MQCRHQTKHNNTAKEKCEQ